MILIIIIAIATIVIVPQRPCRPAKSCVRHNLGNDQWHVLRITTTAQTEHASSQHMKQQTNTNRLL